MKLILLSDTHITMKTSIGRTDDVGKAVFTKFEFILKYSAKHNIPILQAADFFHSPREWNTLFRIMNLLKKYKDKGVKIYSIFGEHDMYLYADVKKSATSLGILQRADLVTILNKNPTPLSETIDVYGCSSQESVPVPKDAKKINILVIHAPIYDKPLFPQHQYYSSRRFLKKHKKYKLILAGDIHRKFQHTIGGRHIVNTGPMVRREASKYNLQHVPMFFVYNVKRNILKEILLPCRPSEEVLNRDHIDQKDRDDDIAANFGDTMPKFVKLLKDGGSTNINLKLNIKNYIDSCGGIINGEVKQIISKEMEDEPGRD